MCLQVADATCLRGNLKHAIFLGDVEVVAKALEQRPGEEEEKDGT